MQRTNDAEYERGKNLAFFFDEGDGYLFVKWIGSPTQGQVMVVRSVADGMLYVRKVGYPRVDHGDTPCSEVLMYRPHHQIPTLIDWTNYPSPEPVGAIPYSTRTTATIWKFCNGGDLERFVKRYDGLFPTAFVWHLLERMLNVLHFLHFQCNPPVAQYDFALRNIFLHWDGCEKLPQLLLGDFGYAQHLDFDCRSGRIVWQRMKEEYIQLYSDVNKIIQEHKARGARYPDSLMIFLETMRASFDDIDSDPEPEMQYRIAREKVKWLLNAVRTVSKDCIAVYRDRGHDLRAGALKMPTRPDLAASADLMVLMHPLPIGPSKIVEVDTKTFNVLGVRSEIDDGLPATPEACVMGLTNWPLYASTPELFLQDFLSTRSAVQPSLTLYFATLCIPRSSSPAHIMLSLRRSALRVLSSSPSSLAYKPRSITSLSSSSLFRSKPVSSPLQYQRRWATTEAEEQKNEEEAPVSKLQPTPAEEVENAIDSDNAKAAEGAGETITEEVKSELSGETSAAQESAGDGSFLISGQQDRSSTQDEVSRQERIARPKPTVYIGNLFFDVTEDDLSRELARFGQIKKIRLLRDSRGLSKGFGYVDFEDTEAATKAIQALHQQLFEGRRLVVQYAAFTSEEMDKRREFTRTGTGRVFEQKPKNPPSKTLFIGNMSFEMTDRDLNNLFRGIRNVVDVRVAIDRRTGQPRGFAHADFVDVKSAMEALQLLSEKETYGRKLRVDYSFGNSMAPRNQGVPPQQG